MMITVPADEIRSSLKGAWRILFREPTAVSYFNMTPRGFWNSFQAIWILLIPYMGSMLAERRWLVEQENVALETFPSAGFFALKFVGIGLDWVLVPVILWLAADILDIKTRYGSYIIARNWASVIMAWVFFIPTIAYLIGLITFEVMIFVELILLGFVLIYGYRIARATLNKEPLFCMAVVFADFMIGIVVGQALWKTLGSALDIQI